MINKKNLIIAMAIGGLAPGLLSNLPIVNSLDVLPCIVFVIVAFLGGSILSVWIYKRLAGSLSARQAVSVGTWTGVAAAFPSFVIALISHIEAPFRLRIYPDSLPIPGEFAVGFSVVLGFMRVGFNIMLGWLGGVIARRIFIVRQPNLP